MSLTDEELLQQNAKADKYLTLLQNQIDMAEIEQKIGQDKSSSPQISVMDSAMNEADI